MPRRQMAESSGAQTDTERQVTDDGFRTVRSRRTKRKTKKQSDSGSKRENNITKQKKEKIERLKKVDVPKTFVIKVDEGRDKNEAKQTLWSEILKKTDKTQLSGARVTTKGDIKITVGDDETYQVLKEIAEVRGHFEIGNRKLPMVMIYDVDISLTTDEIPIYLA